MSGYGWAVELDGVMLTGGDADGIGCLTSPPDGLGLPPIRTEDVTYPQRDGVRHFADWYEPRIITLENVRVCPTDCVGCGDVRQRVRDILTAWSRRCDDVELVIYTPCHGESSGEGPQPGGLECLPDGWSSACGDMSAVDFTGAWSIEVDADITWDETFPSYLWVAVTDGFMFQINPTNRVPTATFPGGVEVGLPPIPELPTGRAVYRVERDGDLIRLLIDGVAVSQVALPGLTVGPVESPCVNFGVGSGPRYVVYRVSVSQGNTLVETRFDDSPWLPGDTAPTVRDGFELTQDATVLETVGPTPASRSLNGPFGILGRPRVAEVTWGSGARLGRCATLTLRFDARDHRMFVLDDDGTPGSGSKTVRVDGGTSSACANVPMCFPFCFDTQDDDDGGETSTVNEGTECVGMTVCFYGTLTDPVLENVTTGETLSIFGTVSGRDPLCVDTEDGTATQGGANRTHLVGGNPRMTLAVGENIFRLVSFSGSDDGYVTITYRDQVVMA